jgi:hypothetical protein
VGIACTCDSSYTRDIGKRMAVYGQPWAKNVRLYLKNNYDTKELRVWLSW